VTTRFALLLTAVFIAVCPVAGQAQSPCAAPAAVCAAAQRVFSIASFDPAASAVLIAPGLLVTNRHVIANHPNAAIIKRDGTRLTARVVPTNYPGDLVLLRADGLTSSQPLPLAAAPSAETALHAIGHDVGRQTIRVYVKGHAIRTPAPDKPLARLHHTARSQPGNSGGALVNAQGHLVGIVTAGGEGRHDAIPATEIARLKDRSGPAHRDVHDRIGLAYRQCMAATDAAGANRRAMTPKQADFMIERCQASNNRQLIDLAAQALGKRGRYKQSVDLFEAAIAQDPNAVNSRLGLVVSLHLARRYTDEVPHLKELIKALPADLQVLRFAIQAGTWGEAPELAATGMSLLKTHHPKLAPLAKRFMQTPPPKRRP